MTVQEERQSTSILILPSLWREAKKAAVDDSMTVSEWMEDAILQKLGRTKKQ